jgi:hypothetical protein
MTRVQKFSKIRFSQGNYKWKYECLEYVYSSTGWLVGFGWIWLILAAAGSLVGWFWFWFCGYFEENIE